jgi:hypothetical protein
MQIHLLRCLKSRSNTHSIKYLQRDGQNCYHLKNVWSSNLKQDISALIIDTSLHPDLERWHYIRTQQQYRLRNYLNCTHVDRRRPNFFISFMYTPFFSFFPGSSLSCCHCQQKIKTSPLIPTRCFKENTSASVRLSKSS